MCIFVQWRSEFVKYIQENRFNIKKKELCESLKKLNTILLYGFTMFSCQFLYWFPFKSQIQRCSYNIYHYPQAKPRYIYTSSVVTCCHVSPIFVCIRYLHLPVRSIFQICTFPRYVIRIINNPEWITICISRKLPQYGSVRCLKLYN